MAMEPSENDIRFLMSLFEMTQGDGDIQVSMHDVGNSIGLDKGEATQAAEWVMGAGWAELKTLSGGIGISVAGVEKAVSLGAKLPQGSEAIVRLGGGPIIDDGVRNVLESLIASLKLEVVQKNLDFDTTAEVVADIRTLDLQLSSPRPKTTIIRAGLESIKAIMQKGDASKLISLIDQLIGL